MHTGTMIAKAGSALRVKVSERPGVLGRERRPAARPVTRRPSRDVRRHEPIDGRLADRAGEGWDR